MLRELYILYLMVFCLTTPWRVAAQNSCLKFNAVDDAFLCIRSQYIRSKPNARTVLSCSLLCTKEPLCQAFAIPAAVGSCQLFVFDRCSVRVRECGNCVTRGRVFVRSQEGLPSGALCPSGYGDDMCGSKYRLYSGIQNWELSRQRCASDSGLVIMADVIDSAEMTHVDMICDRSSTVTFLGGFQPAGSPEPAGGWIWASCGTPIDPSIWCCNEPNNNDGHQNVTARWTSDYRKLSDVNHDTTQSVLCECVSPFD